MGINEKNQGLGTDFKGSCPDWLAPEAKAEWERLAPKLAAMGNLTRLYLSAFAVYCTCYGHVLQLEREIQEHKEDKALVHELKQIQDTYAMQALEYRQEFGVGTPMTETG